MKCSRMLLVLGLSPVWKHSSKVGLGLAVAGVFALPVLSSATSQGLNLAPAVAYGTGGSRPLSVAVADVNRDGKPDLVVANDCATPLDCSNTSSGVVSVLLGNGDGTFKPAVTFNPGGFGGAYPISVAVADVNGDGKPDLLVANGCAASLNCGSNGSNGVAGVLLGNGDGTFQTAVTYNSGGVLASLVAVADVNGDGKPDLLVSNLCAFDGCGQTGGVGVLLGKGDGTFQPAVTYNSGGPYAFSVAVADVNGDGKPDLLVANQNFSVSNGQIGGVGVLLGNGDGTFKAAMTYASGGQGPRSLAIADVNGDGKPDVVVANENISISNSQNGGVGVLLGNGDGTFQAPVAYYSGGYEALWVLVADVNGDGKPDVLVANACASYGDCNNNNSTGGMSVLLGNGDGTVQMAVTYGSGGNIASSVTIGDVNGDHKPDLIVANECGNTPNCSGLGTVGVLINTSASFGTTPYTFTSLIPPFRDATQSVASGINDLGTIVGEYNTPSTPTLNGFVLQKGTYTTLDVPGSPFTQATAINVRGDIVGWYAAAQNHGFILQGNVLTNIDFPGQVDTTPFGINSRGDIVGFYGDNGSRLHAFLREGDEFTTIDVPFPGVTSTGASGINDREQIVGFYVGSDGREHGFLKEGSEFHSIDVPFPGVIGTDARGINNKGEIVGDYIDSSAAQHGFIFAKGEFTRLDPSFPGVTVLHTNAWGINDLGEVVGFYYIFSDSNFRYIGYLAKPLSAGQ